MPVDPPLRVVYRALLGGYETLREEPAGHESGVDFVCFTDDPDLTSETWRLVLVEPRFPADLVRSARHLKIVGHPVLETYDETLWLDNTVELLVPPEEIFDDWLADADLALPLHSYRTSVVDEAEAVLELGRDDYVRVYEQMSVYSRTAPAALEANPHWTGMLARRRVPVVREAMQDWWEHLLRFSHRDQLSFVATVPRPGLRLRSVAVDNHASRLHRWPRAAHRRTDRPGPSLRDALRPPRAEVSVLRRRLELAEQDHAFTREQREREQAALHAELAARGDRIAHLTTEVAVLHGRLQEASTRVDQLNKQTLRLRSRNLRLRDSIDPENDRPLSGS